ncbi:tyrosine-type recombinase/integrase [Roseomonas gilardii]|uniref:tyrosine-type recombinase/integrase n=1 Tax=Roseomonas gilardii TaxID=257708 RepID=UPI0004B42ED6|nr:tyrosine-type recombinase/integrase [Roseomonas gilardii]
MNNLQRAKGGTYYVRLDIPESRVRDAGRAYATPSGRKTEIIRSLRTTLYQEALERRGPALEAIRAEVNERLAMVRLPPLGGDWTADWMKRAEERRRELQRASREEPGHDLLSAYDETLNETIEEARELESRVSDTASTAFLRRATSNDLTVQDAFDRWIKAFDGVRANQTLMQHRQALKLLGEFLTTQGFPGGDPISSVGMDAVRGMLAGEWREWLLDSGRHPRTVARLLSSMSSFWSWAVDERHYATTNPWTGKAKGLKERAAKLSKGKPPKRAYTAAELVALLRSDPNEGRRWGYGPAMFDLVRLGLLTGARLDEICSLTLGDVASDCSSFTVREGKTANASRTIPVHELAQGVLRTRVAEAQARKAQGTADPKDPDVLFAECPAGGPDSKRGWTASKRFTEFRRIVLPQAERTDFHSLRRSVATHLEAAEAKGGTACVLTVRQDLAGHSRNDLLGSVYVGAGSTPMDIRRTAIRQMVDLGMSEDVRKALEETQDRRPQVARKERSRPYADPRNVRRATVAKRGRAAPSGARKATKAG